MTREPCARKYPFRLFLNTWPSRRYPFVSHAPPVDDFFLLNESLRISCPADDGRFSIVGDGGGSLLQARQWRRSGADLAAVLAASRARPERISFRVLLALRT